MICEHCKMDTAIRNPSGFCDHLYYPDNCVICVAKKPKSFEYQLAFTAGKVEGYRDGMKRAAEIADTFSIEAFHEMTESWHDTSKEYWRCRESQAEAIADKILKELPEGSEGKK